MTQLKIAINKDINTVWEEIKDIVSHAQWMDDARSVELISGEANTVGAKYLCITKVGPLKTKDIFEIKKYEKPNEMEIYHEGLISGIGYFKLKELNENITEFVWEEKLKFPIYFGSFIGKKVAMTFLHNIWRKNLLNLKDRIENKQ